MSGICITQEGQLLGSYTTEDEMKMEKYPECVIN